MRHLRWLDGGWQEHPDQEDDRGGRGDQLGGRVTDHQDGGFQGEELDSLV